MSHPTTPADDRPTTRRTSWRTRLSVAVALATATFGVVAAPGSTAQASGLWTRTASVCSYTSASVCLTSSDSYNRIGWVGGHVTSSWCNASGYGAGNSCSSVGSGSYWAASRGYWEDWTTRSVNVYPGCGLGNHCWFGPSQTCVYLRIDTRPSGYTTFQAFTNQGLAIGTRC